MWLNLFRGFALVLLTHAGYVYTPFRGQPLAGALLGLMLGIGLITLEARLRNVPAYHVVGALIGGAIGLVAARLIWGALTGLDAANAFTATATVKVRPVVGSFKVAPHAALPGESLTLS